MTFFINPSRFAVVGGGPTYPLDAIKTAVGAHYSPYRKVYSAWSGALIRAQRASDSAQSDFGAASDGTLDSAALLAWAGATATLVTIYDQTGNGNHATASSQNVIVSGSALQKPLAVAQSTGQMYAIPSGIWSGKTGGAAVVLWNQDAGGSGVGGWAKVSSVGTDIHTPWSDNNAYEGFLSSARPGIGSGGYTRNAGVVHMHGVQHDGTNLQVWRDGVSKGTSAAAFTNAPSTRSFPWIGQGGSKFYEYIFCTRTLTTGERELLEGSITWGHGFQALLPGGHTYASAAPT